MTHSGRLPRRIGWTVAALCAGLAVPAAAQMTEELIQEEKDWSRARGNFVCSSVSYARADEEAGARHRETGLALGRPIVERALARGVTPQTVMPHMRVHAQILATSPGADFALGRIYQDLELLFARRFLEHMEEAAAREDDREMAAAEFLDAAYADMGCETLGQPG